MKTFRQLVENIVTEMAYPSNFSLEEFTAIPHYNKRIQYCKERLKSLGQGSARWVFQIDDEKVLKIAKNRKGLGQNARESAHVIDAYQDLFAKVFEADPDDIWLEMELARPARVADVKRLLGVDMNQLLEIMLYIGDMVRDGVSRHSTEAIEDIIRDVLKGEASEWNTLRELYYYCHDYGVRNPMDYSKTSSWGIVTRNGEDCLVIIDNGFDQRVYDNYYRK